MIIAQAESYNEFMANTGTVLLPIAIFCLGIFFWKLYRYFEQKLLVWLSSVYFIRFLLYAIILWFDKYLGETKFDIRLMWGLFFASYIIEIFFYILLAPKLTALKACHMKKKNEAGNV